MCIQVSMRQSKKVNKVGQQFNTAHILYKRSTARFAGNLLWKDIFFCGSSFWSFLQTSSSTSMSSQLPLLSSRSSPPSTSSSSEGVPEPDAERSSPSGNSAIGRPPGSKIYIIHSTGVNININMNIHCNVYYTCPLDSLLQVSCDSRMTNFAWKPQSRGNYSVFSA